MISVGSLCRPRLGQILSQAARFGDHDVFLTDCTDDVEKLRAGQIYVAVVRADRDGHDEITRAVRHGASAVVAERYVSVPVPLYVVQDTREALGTLHHARAGNPCQHLFTAAVAGQHGKSSTCHLATSVLHESGRAAACGTNWPADKSGWPDLGVLGRSGSSSVAQALAKWQRAGGQAAVLECDHAGLLERRWAGTKLDAAVVTDTRGWQARPHYLDQQAPQQMLERLAALLKPGRPLVLSADTPSLLADAQRLGCATVSYGLSPDADVWGKLVERDVAEQTFLLTIRDQTVPVRTATVGDWWIRHCLAAAAIGWVAGASIAEIARGLERLPRLPARLERLVCGQPFNLFLDHSRRADRFLEMLRTLRQLTSGRLWCVFALDESVPPAERSRWGRVAERFCDAAILTANRKNSTALYSIYHDVLDGYHRPARGHLIADPLKALRFVFHRASPGDTILLSSGTAHGSGPFWWPCTDQIALLLRELDETTELREVTEADPKPVIYKFPGC
ncbi:MAG: UDP-N-acetylmuramoyl-L-alanyl-D-glutamate--2,6-diaminopimelate ligase [Pirellulaceae bacterium]|nr:MAG: UDP-N-acetylmuramoyl-L-alanyl-D-glutamate--2,6-diaminopimelate ligase [Pirellulaceae bacterium]